MRNELVEQAEVQSQLGGHLKVVLPVEEVARLLESVIDKRTDAGSRLLSQHEIGETEPAGRAVGGIACEVAAEGKASPRRGRLQDAEVDDGLELGAEFPRVAAGHHAQCLDEVPDVLELRRRLEGGAAERGNTARVKAGQAAVARREWDARQADLR